MSAWLPAELGIRERASDLLVKAGAPPALRVDGLVRPTAFEVMTAEDTEELARDIIYTASRDYLLQFHGTGPELKDLEVAEARMKEIPRLDEVKWAVLETSGQISFIKKSS